MAGVSHAAAAGGHGAEGASAFPPFDASLFQSQLIWFALTFAALYFVVWRYITPSVEGVLTKRAGALKADLDAAQSESAAADSARAAAERANAEARAEARLLVENGRASVQTALAAEAARTEEGLAQQIAAAEARVGEMRQAALAQVQSLSDDLARDVVARLAPGARA
jgi:F-type H+-transporting ATPase subunit b